MADAFASPEANLLLQVASVGGDVRGALDAAVDWQHAVTLAKRHRVLPLLTRALHEQRWNGVPGDVATSLTDHRRRQAARNTHLAKELVRIVTLLDAAGVEALPYKGPMLSLAAYGDITMRPFGDLDLLVSRSDALAAKQLLLRDGYTSLTPATDAVGASAHPLDNAYELTGPNEFMVELHWSIAGWLPVGLHDLRDATRTQTLLGVAVRDLSPEHQVLVQCVQRKTKAWSRLEWVAALAHTVARAPELSWDGLWHDADALGARAAVTTGLSLARRLGAAVPASVPHCDADVFAAMLRGSGGVLSARQKFRIDLANRQMRGKLRYLAALRHPSERDYAFVRLPRSLTFLYAGVRPVRVVLESTVLRTRRRSAT